MTLLAAPVAAWLPVARGSVEVQDRPLTRRGILLRVLALALLMAVLVITAGGLVARRIAIDQAIRDSKAQAEILAADVAQPAVQNGLATGSPAAVAALDRRVRASVLRPSIVRVKAWNAAGTIVYSDEPRLIGRTFGFPVAEHAALAGRGTQADVSDLDDPDNVYERGRGQLLEVHQTIHAPDGTPLLFEVYFSYDRVIAESNTIWASFVILTGASVLLLLAALLPFLDSLVGALERTRQQREALLTKALDASDAERRRIVAAVHDGPVQDLVGASYQVGAGAATYAGTEAGAALQTAETTVRGAIDSLRSTLVDIYPATLEESGFEPALRRLVAAARLNGAQVSVHVSEDLGLSPAAERLVFRIARETLANSVKHGDGALVRFQLVREGSQVVLTVQDDGPGFDAADVIASPPEGHFGLRLLRDAVDESGVAAGLDVRSAPGAGTAWRLTLA